MVKTKKIRLKESRGNPTGGPVIRAGATIEIAAFWADKWIAEGVAVAIETDTAPSAKTEGKCQCGHTKDDHSKENYGCLKCHTCFAFKQGKNNAGKNAKSKS